MSETMPLKRLDNQVVHNSRTSAQLRITTSGLCLMCAVKNWTGRYQQRRVE